MMLSRLVNLNKRVTVNKINKLNMSTAIGKNDEKPCNCTPSENLSDEKVGPIEESIAEVIKHELKPSYLKIRNDSWKHSHHNAMRDADNIKESHFYLTIISNDFKDCKGLPARHRLVYKLLDKQINEMGVHAIQLKTKTPEEWEIEQSRKSTK